jgi:hypothetical protein
VSLAVMTTVAGFFGMNLEIPIVLDGGFTSGAEHVGGLQFLIATGSAVALGGTVYGFGLAHATGSFCFLQSCTKYSFMISYHIIIIIIIFKCYHVCVHQYPPFKTSNKKGMLRRLNRNGVQDVDEIVALGRIFEDMSSIEHAVYRHLYNNTDAKPLTKEGFTAFLEKETSREVTTREVDLIFEVFDVTKDGKIRENEIAMATEIANRQSGLVGVGLDK